MCICCRIVLVLMHYRASTITQVNHINMRLVIIIVWLTQNKCFQLKLFCVWTTKIRTIPSFLFNKPQMGIFHLFILIVGKSTVQLYTYDNVQYYSNGTVKPLNHETIQPYSHETVQLYSHDSVQPWNCITLHPRFRTNVQPWNRSWTVSHETLLPYSIEAIVTFSHETVQPYSYDTV